VTELKLRLWHRRVGIVLALFLVLQGLSGLLLSLEGFSEPPARAGGSVQVSEPESELQEVLEAVHFGGGPVGALYRLGLGLGLVWMAGSGATIYRRIRSRATGRSGSKPHGSS